MVFEKKKKEANSILLRNIKVSKYQKNSGHLGECEE
jgi:hypothetical protein